MSCYRASARTDPDERDDPPRLRTTIAPEGLTATIERALQIAARAHEGQVDKEGLPYILHPLRVMDGVEGTEAKIVAVLHDAIEDTPVTADDLRREGFDEAVVAAVA